MIRTLSLPCITTIDQSTFSVDCLTLSECELAKEGGNLSGYIIRLTLTAKEL